MNEREYLDEIISLEAAFFEAIRDGDITDDESARGWLWQTLDGHEYVIYTYNAKMVGIHTSNPDAMLDEMGPEGLVRDGNIHYEGMAYMSMMADLMERIDWPDFDDEDAMSALHAEKIDA